MCECLGSDSNAWGASMQASDLGPTDRFLEPRLKNHAELAAHDLACRFARLGLCTKIFDRDQHMFPA